MTITFFKKKVNARRSQAVAEDSDLDVLAESNGGIPQLIIVTAFLIAV